MVTICCVEGCEVTDNDENALFHKFPRKANLKETWSAVIPLRNECSEAPDICSHHFLPSDYRTIRDRRRLHTDAVPSVFPNGVLTSISIKDPERPLNGSADIPSESDTSDRCSPEAKPKRKRSPSPTKKHKKHKSSHKRSKSKDKEKNDKSDGSLDLEDNIPSFVIHDTNPTARRRIDSRSSSGLISSSAEVENMEVSIDPASIMMNEPIIEASIDLSQEPDPPRPPSISLLTSSDEDEVIIQEPVYDLIEVSDDTDDEDQPLITIKNKSNRVNTTTIKQSLMNKIICEYFCVICQYKTQYRSQYTRHVKTHSEVLLTCPFCAFNTLKSEKFRKHVMRHTDRILLLCHLCSFQCKNLKNLVTHLEDHIVYKCDFCTLVSIDEKALSKHEKKHKLKYKCSTCNKKYSSKKSRNKHLLKHRKSNQDINWVSDN